ncbi:uncharacterized protein LOC142221867 [Haematobia irritans]|uniref:uncharacterized protein LOC142221867 n=1 Tax=Haematobia irritans TaxID=7368 RepID=UPI003F4FFB0E
MTNITRINGKQKLILAEFMSEHPSLAKNHIRNCAQARATSKKLWDQLTTKLNASGPPCKNSVAWKKVYTDQKHSVKKKLSFNKASLKRTGGGPYEEKKLSAADEQISEAAGLTAAVEGLVSVESFGSSGLQGIDNAESSFVVSDHEDTFETPKRRVPKAENKLTLLKLTWTK